jgi:hypothetical protein
MSFVELIFPFVTLGLGPSAYAPAMTFGEVLPPKSDGL